MMLMQMSFRDKAGMQTMTVMDLAVVQLQYSVLIRADSLQITQIVMMLTVKSFLVRFGTAMQLMLTDMETLLTHLHSV